MAAVLVVDDNADACRMMAKLVRACGHETTCVTSGEAALEHLSASPADLVILDNMMPGMNGVEVLRKIRDDPKTRAIPVVMWSAIGDPQFKQHARSKGASDYWQKAGFDYAQLPSMLNRLVGRGRD